MLFLSKHRKVHMTDEWKLWQSEMQEKESFDSIEVE